MHIKNSAKFSNTNPTLATNFRHGRQRKGPLLLHARRRGEDYEMPPTRLPGFRSAARPQALLHPTVMSNVEVDSNSWSQRACSTLQC